MRTRIVLLLTLSTAFVALAGSRMSYVFKYGGHSHMMVNGPIESLAQTSKKYTGDFIWVRRNGREVVIRDTKVLAEAAAAFREVDAFEPTVREAEKKLKPYEKRMEELERRMDAISDEFDDESLTDDARAGLEAKLREVEEQVRDMESKMRGFEEALDRAEEIMDQREERAERKLEAILERALQR